VIGSLLSMRLPPFQRPVKMASMWEHVAEGFRFVRRTGPVRALLLLVGLVSLVAMPYAVLMPIFADRILHAGARGLGILMGATGIGAVSGALTLAMKKGLKGLGRWVPMAVCCSGLALIAFSFSRIFWLSAVLLVPVGYGVMLQMSSTNTLIQAMVPDHLRGRVMAVYAMMFMGMVPIGALLAGVAAHHIGAALTVACGGALAVAGAALFARNIPKMRNRARELIVAQGMEVEGSQREIPARGIS
jgi:MFS family permease